MKLLLSNILSTATITALHEDTNNPLVNLYATFLRQRYQSTALSDMITITFPSPISLNSFFYGYTNASSMAIQFYDNSGNELFEFDDFVLATEDGFDLATEDGFSLSGYDGFAPNQIDAIIFDAITVKSITVSLSGAANVYLGGIGVGTVYAPPFPSDTWQESFEDRSVVSMSQAGQTLAEYVQPLRAYDFTFEGLTRAELNALQAAYVDLGVGNPIWIELLDDHTELAPLYGTITEAPGTNRARMLLSITYKFKEAR